MDLPRITARLAVLAAALSACQGPALISEVDVAGVVVSREGHPAPGLRVKIGDAAPVFTDGDGAFKLARVRFPYDALVTSENHVVAYRGLTRPDPVLRAPQNAPSVAARSGTVLGDVGGANLVAYATPQGVVALDPGPSLDHLVAWSGPDTLVTTLHALQLTFDASGLPSGFSQYGKASLAVGNQQAVTGFTVALDIATGHPVSGSVTRPSGATGVSLGVSTRLASGEEVPLARGAGLAGAAFGFVAPDLPGARARVVAFASEAAGGTSFAAQGGLVPGAATAVLAPPAFVEPSEPASSATGVGPGTRFAWPSLPGATYLLYANETSGFGEITVVTAVPEAVLPAPGDAGTTFPSGGEFIWKVYAVAPCPSIDAAATQAGCGLFWFGTFGSVGDRGWASRNRVFSTP